MWPSEPLQVRWEYAWVNVFINFFVSQQLSSQLIKCFKVDKVSKHWRINVNLRVLNKIKTKPMTTVWSWCVVLKMVQELPLRWCWLMAWVLQSSVGEVWVEQAGLAWATSHSTSRRVSSYMSCYVACSMLTTRCSKLSLVDYSMFNIMEITAWPWHSFQLFRSWI